MDVAAAAVSSELDAIFTLTDEERTPAGLSAFSAHFHFFRLIVAHHWAVTCIMFHPPHQWLACGCCYLDHLAVKRSDRSTLNVTGGLSMNLLLFVSFLIGLPFPNVFYGFFTR